MIFPNKPSSAHKFEVGDVIATHREDNIAIRKHSSGSFTALVDGEPKPARQYLIEIRNALGLPDKATNTTRSLGSQVFGKLESKYSTCADKGRGCVKTPGMSEFSRKRPIEAFCRPAG